MAAGPVVRTFAVGPTTVRTVAITAGEGRVPVGGPEVAVTVSGRRFVDGDGLSLVGDAEASPEDGPGSRGGWRRPTAVSSSTWRSWPTATPA